MCVCARDVHRPAAYTEQVRVIVNSVLYVHARMESTAHGWEDCPLVSAYPFSIRWQTWHEEFRWDDWRLIIYGQDPFWLHANGWWKSACVSSGLEQQDLLRFCLDCNTLLPWFRLYLDGFRCCVNYVFDVAHGFLVFGRI